MGTPFREMRLGKLVSNPVDLLRREQDQLPVTEVGADTDALREGVYAVWCDVDVWLKVDSSDASDVTEDTGYILLTDTVEAVLVRAGHKIGAIAAAGSSGTLRYHKIG